MTDHYIKQWREIRGLSLREAEALIGDDRLSYSSIARIENGQQPYNEGTLALLAKAYGVEPWVLLSVNPLRRD